MTIDFSRECKRLFLCTELSPLGAYLDQSKSDRIEVRFGAIDRKGGRERCCRSSGRATKRLMFGSEQFGFIRAARYSGSISRFLSYRLTIADPDTGRGRTLLRCRAPIDHLGDPHGCFRIEPDAIGHPALLAESKRHFKGLRVIGRG
jgi:hypothetical protein